VPVETCFHQVLKVKQK